CVALCFAFYFLSSNSGIYSSLMQIPYFLLLFSFALILWYSGKKAIIQNQKEYWWFVSIFFFYYILAFIMIMLETGHLKYSYQEHAILIAFGAIPQMTLTLLFLIYRVLTIFKNHTREVANERVKTQQAILKER